MLKIGAKKQKKCKRLKNKIVSVDGKRTVIIKKKPVSVSKRKKKQIKTKAVVKVDLSEKVIPSQEKPIVKIRKKTITLKSKKPKSKIKKILKVSRIALRGSFFLLKAAHDKATKDELPQQPTGELFAVAKIENIEKFAARLSGKALYRLDEKIVKSAINAGKGSIKTKPKIRIKKRGGVTTLKKTMPKQVVNTTLGKSKMIANKAVKALTNKSTKLIGGLMKAALSKAKGYIICAVASSLLFVVTVCVVLGAISILLGFFLNNGVSVVNQEKAEIIIEVEKEFTDRIYDAINNSGTDAITYSSNDGTGKNVRLKEVLILYYVKYNSDYTKPLILNDLNAFARLQFKKVYNDLNNISTARKSYFEDEIIYNDDGTESTVTTEKFLTTIIFMHYNIYDVAREYGFNDEQLEKVTFLMDESLNSMWRTYLK